MNDLLCDHEIQYIFANSVSAKKTDSLHPFPKAIIYVEKEERVTVNWDFGVDFLIPPDVKAGMDQVAKHVYT